MYETACRNECTRTCNFVGSLIMSKLRMNVVTPENGSMMPMSRKLFLALEERAGNRHTPGPDYSITTTDPFPVTSLQNTLYLQLV